MGTVREKLHRNIGKGIPLTDRAKEHWSTKIFQLAEDRVKGIEGRVAIEKCSNDILDYIAEIPNRISGVIQKGNEIKAKREAKRKKKLEETKRRRKIEAIMREEDEAKARAAKKSAEGN